MSILTKGNIRISPTTKSIATPATTANKHSTGEKLVDYLLSGFLRGCAQQTGNQPGFGHALKIGYNTIDPKRLWYQPETHTLTYRYQLSKDVPKYTVGLLTALMDDLSSDACFIVGQPSMPGSSVQFQTELMMTTADLKSNDNPLDNFKTTTSSKNEIDVINTVTKLGKTISHTQCEFQCVQTNQLLAISSHVKYMSTGSFLFDWLLTNPYIFNLYEQLVIRNTPIKVYDEEPLFTNIIQSRIHYSSNENNNDGDKMNDNDKDNAVAVKDHPTATFHATYEHTNPLGVIHGGCQAMVMEQAAIEYVQEQYTSSPKAAASTTNGNRSPFVESIQIGMLKVGKVGTIDIYCETIHSSSSTGASTSPTLEDGSTVLVRVLLKQKQRLTTEGKVRVRI